MHILIRTGALGIAHIPDYSAILKNKGILTFNDKSLGIICSQDSVFNSNRSCGIHSRRIIAVCRIAASVYIYRSATSVRTNSSSRASGDFDCQIACVCCASACGLDSTGIISSSRNFGIRNQAYPLWFPCRPQLELWHHQNPVLPFPHLL